MIRRGGERGLKRAEHQTPYEYAAIMECAVPDVDKDVTALTEDFVIAR